MKTTAIQTINIIEYANNTVTGIRSFADNKNGNKEAENLYCSIIKEHDPDTIEPELDLFLENGYYEQGDYQIFLTHST